MYWLGSQGEHGTHVVSATALQSYSRMYPGGQTRHAWHRGGVVALHVLTANVLLVHAAGQASQYGGLYPEHGWVM